MTTATKSHIHSGFLSKLNSTLENVISQTREKIILYSIKESIDTFKRESENKIVSLPDHVSFIELVSQICQEKIAYLKSYFSESYTLYILKNQLSQMTDDELASLFQWQIPFSVTNSEISNFLFETSKIRQEWALVSLDDVSYEPTPIDEETKLRNLEKTLREEIQVLSEFYEETQKKLLEQINSGRNLDLMTFSSWEERLNYFLVALQLFHDNQVIIENLTVKLNE